MIKVNNIEAYAKDYKYIVARQVRGNGQIEHWFYGAWDDRCEANEVAMEIGNGVVFESVDCFPPHVENNVSDPLMNIIYGACEREYKSAKWNSSSEAYELEQHMMFLHHMLCTD